MAQELLLLSPEKTILSFNLARLGTRLFAQLFDVVVLSITFFVLTIGINTLTSISMIPSVGVALTLFLFGVGPFLYFILFEGLWNGQTPGKKVLGIRVRMADGTPLSFGAALARNLLRPADFLPMAYFLGLLAVFTNQKSQRIGDMVANTVVLHVKRAEPYFTPAPYVLGIHPFEAHVGELRGMTNEQYVALKRLCDRFPELPTPIQDKLIVEVWQPLGERLKVSPLPNVHPIYLAEAVVMKYGRSHGLL